MMYTLQYTQTDPRFCKRFIATQDSDISIDIGLLSLFHKRLRPCIVFTL